jgi:transcription termination factor Rho
VTETDLITAGGSSEDVELPNTVISDTSTTAEADASIATPTAETAPTADMASGNRAASLSTMVLPELRALAKEVGVQGASGMRKGELVAAIRERRGESNGRPSEGATDTNSTQAPATDTATEPATDERRSDQASTEQTPQRRERRGASRGAGAADGSDENKPEPDQQKKADTQGDRPAKRDGKADSGDQQQGDQQGGQNREGGNLRMTTTVEGGRRAAVPDAGARSAARARRRRPRVPNCGRHVVQLRAGILDARQLRFVRTSGYPSSQRRVRVLNMVQKRPRRGDAITGASGAKDGEQPNQRQKFNPLVRPDTVNGGPVEDAKKRPDFNKLTPLYPNQRLRLETTPDRLTTRVIDLIMPIGKGQRALIVSPPKAGKTTILQDIANGVAKNNPECHLMVVLVDERPEEVTDMQRSVKGEVIASTFDRPPSDHTQAAELAIERAKRLVEQGKDVIVLLDSITRLGRAYNNASPASGRILSGGVDSTALYPPKRFLGAARNIEDGGSLTIIATAMVETGSTGDTVIFEEFKGTGNAELKLDRKISERRVFPAVDVNPSGTRKDELLLPPDEFAVVHKLRRVLSGLDPHQAIDLLMSQLRKTKNNYEFLMQVSKTAPGSMDSD